MNETEGEREDEGGEKINLPKVERPRDRHEMKYDWYFIAARDIDPYIEIIDWIIICRL